MLLFPTSQYRQCNRHGLTETAREGVRALRYGSKPCFAGNTAHTLSVLHLAGKKKNWQLQNKMHVLNAYSNPSNFFI